MKYEVLAGLPAYGALPIQFDENPSGSEGLVVQFSPDLGPRWVGNFLGGLGTLNEVFEHPNGAHIAVVAHGELYVIDPESKELISRLGSAFQTSFHCNDKKLVILGTFTEFVAIGTHGVQWKSKRISWDGFLDLKCDCKILMGNSWGLGDTWVPFTLDVENGSHTGGGFIE